MKVIIECDDLGLDYGFTDAISHVYNKGIATSTCIRVNGPAYNYSRKILKDKLKGIGLGIHIDLTHGPFLTNLSFFFPGKYPLTFIEIALRITFGDIKLTKALENEIDAQFKKAISAGLKIDHVNGHDHIHMIPKIFALFAKISKKYHVNKIRLVDEPFHFTFNFLNLLKFILLKSFSLINKIIAKKYELIYPDAFYGLIDTNHMSKNAILFALQNGISNNFDIIEITTHPAYKNHPKDLKIDLTDFAKKFTNLPNRQIEMEGLLDKKIVRFINKHKIKLITYKDI